MVSKDFERNGLKRKYFLNPLEEKKYCKKLAITNIVKA
jgi:hypothetical protein